MHGAVSEAMILLEEAGLLNQNMGIRGRQFSNLLCHLTLIPLENIHNSEPLLLCGVSHIPEGGQGRRKGRKTWLKKNKPSRFPLQLFTF